MLHDELKNINTDFNFYEEDETDKVARYSGKWEICRVVTNDSENEDMYFFELHASNGDLLLTSEEYTTYNGAIRGIETHKSNILHGNFRLSLSKKGDYTFRLLNGKGMLLCLGDHYPTKAACEMTIEQIKASRAQHLWTKISKISSLKFLKRKTSPSKISPIIFAVSG